MFSNSMSQATTLSHFEARILAGATISPTIYSGRKAPAKPDDTQISTSPSQIAFVASTQDFLQPIPVSIAAISASPIRVQKQFSESTLRNSRNFRQGANSASTANVTRMRIQFKTQAALGRTIFLARRGAIYPFASYQRTARSNAADTGPA